MKKPDLSPREVSLNLDYVNRLLGLSLAAGEVKELIERMRYGVKVKGKEFTVSVPAYRTDVLHPMDVVEDVAIAYGYMNFRPELPRLPTLGKSDAFALFADELRDYLMGLGFTEVMTLVMTNRSELFSRMNVGEENVAETVKPLSQEHSVARNWLLPSLIGVLGKNKNREYPQKIFEIGDCVSADGRDFKRLCGAIAHSKANFSEVKAIVCGLLDELKLKYEVREFGHGSFIKGRCAQTGYGFFGEVSPIVLDSHGLEVPVSAFELNLDFFKDGS